MSRARVNALVDAACFEAREKASRLNSVTADLTAAQTQRDTCKGELLRLEKQGTQKRTRSPWWLRVGLDVGAPALLGAAGACLGAGCPRELSVGLVTAGVLGVIARLVLEGIDG